jgi:DNA polymerase-3 subunit gamma/tau
LAQAVDGDAADLSRLSPETWPALFEQFGFGGVVGNIVSHCVLVRAEQDRLELVLDEANATLFNEAHVARIQEHLSVALNKPLQLTMTVGLVHTETPAQRKARIAIERKQQAIAAMQQDPNVITLVDQFSASLDIESVKAVY